MPRRRAAPQLRTEADAIRATQADPRLGRNGSSGPLRLGPQPAWHEDLYHRVLTMPWPWFLLLAGFGFLLANALFAGLYLLQPGAVTGAHPGSFADLFFFSVQTVATVGYGQMWPATRYANMLMTAEILLGLLMFALVTSLAFARFSRPTARVLFSRVAVVGPYDGRPALAIRMANERRNQVLEAAVTLSLLRDEVTPEGQFFRRLYDLKLVRSRSPVFAMTFLVLHPLDEDSPLFGASPAALAAAQAELVVAMTGLDETLSQTIHARTSYLARDILFGHRFVDVIGVLPNGARAIDYTRFHDTVPL